MEFKPAVSLTEQIANHLSDEIINGRLAPLERIQELKSGEGSRRFARLGAGGAVDRRRAPPDRYRAAPRRGRQRSRTGADGDLTEFFGELILMLLVRVAAKVTAMAAPHALDGFQVRVRRRWARTRRPSRSMRWCRQSSRFSTPARTRGQVYLSTRRAICTPAMHRVSRRAAEHAISIRATSLDLRARCSMRWSRTIGRARLNWCARTFVARQRSHSTPRFTDRSRFDALSSRAARVTLRYIAEESRAHQ